MAWGQNYRRSGAGRQILTSANGTPCSARHELRSRAFLFIVSAECALPTHASLFVIILSPPLRGGMGLVTNRQDAILSAFTESPGPDWKPGSGFI